MKVLQVNESLNIFSTGKITEEIGQALIQNGHKSYVASAQVGPDGSLSNHVPIGNTMDIYIHGLKTRLLDQHGFGSTHATKQLVQRIKRIDPDVIGLHNLHGYYLNIEVLFAYLKQVQKPVIWTFHDCWPFTGHCCHFDYVGCEKWKAECRKCPISDKYPASWFVDNSRENFHRKKRLFNGIVNLTIVTPSYWLKKLVEQSFLAEYPIKVIHNGIDVDRFQPVKTDELKSKYNLLDKTVLLGVASEWDRIKGFKYFIELNKRLNDNFRIILIGLPTKTIRKLPENIIGIQRTEDTEELVSFYSMADVFVNPTLADNFPTTNIEALACGTPVITFDTGGSPEAIDEETGFVVDKKDLNHLSQAILKITQNGLNGYRRKCRERSIRYFNKDDCYRDYIKLYHKVANKEYEWRK
jgi:glycosyltransferase involved in cell wall biosynthesis